MKISTMPFTPVINTVKDAIKATPLAGNGTTFVITDPVTDDNTTG